MWKANDFDNPVYLVSAVGALENWLACDDFADDAPKAPYIHSLSIPSSEKHQLRCTIPSSTDIVRQLSMVRICTPGAQTLHTPAGQVEVTDLHRAIHVDQNVCRLQVSMGYIKAVEVGQATGDTKQYVPVMFLSEVWTRSLNYRMEVDVHTLLDDVNIISFRSSIAIKAMHLHNVIVVRVAEDTNFTQSPHSI